MELESEDGARVPIDMGSKVEIGRGLGLGFAGRSSSSDRTVSRRHLSLSLSGPSGGDDSSDELRILFEVIGRNPILVCGKGAERKRVFRNSEKGQLRPGDRFSLSLKNPSFFVVRRRERGKAAEVEQTVLDAVERREKRTLERRKEKEMRARVAAAMELASPVAEREESAVDGGLELELGSFNISEIDPAREFGFLVRGHEFDQYPKRKIRPMRDWNWFLDKAVGNSDDDELTDEATSPNKKGRRRKKSKGEDNEDEDWTGESEDEKVSINRTGSAKRPKYSTRLRDPNKPHNGASGDWDRARKDVRDREDTVDEQDEEDETLGGFIVNDDEEEEANGGEWDGEEEEEEEDYEEEDDN